MSKSLTTQITQEQLNELKSLAPVSNDYSKVQLPKLGMLAKDITEETGSGKNKKINIVNVAGEFYVENKTDELNEKGKNIYAKTFFEGETMEGIVVYHRYQLSLWDEAKKLYTSSPIYDSNTDIIPLFEGGTQIAKGTPAELQARYPDGVTKTGRPRYALKEITVLYVLKDGELYEWPLSMSSKYEFSDYKKKVICPSVVTTFGSKEETHGSNTYKKTTFASKRQITAEEFEVVKETVTGIKDAIEAEKRYYATLTAPVASSTPVDITADFGTAQPVLGDGHQM